MAPLSAAPPRTAAAWAAAALATSTLPIAGAAPLPALAALWLAAAWRLAQARAAPRRPARPLLAGRAVRVLAVAGATAAVAAAYGTLLDRAPGTTLLVLGAALKLAELRDRRDATLCALLAFVLLTVGLLHRPELPTPLLGLPALVIGAAALVGIACPEAPVRAALRQGGGALLQAAPFALVLFLLFPRLAGPLWGHPGTGVTGIGGDLELGRVAALARSDTVVMRVRLSSGSPPPPPQRYWRVNVLARTDDGRRWRPARTGAALQQANDGGMRPLEQTVLLLPAHGVRHLPALDRPVSVPAGARAGPAGTLLWPRPVERVLVYRVRSLPAPAGAGGGTAPTREALLEALGLPRLPERIRRLAADLRRQGGDPAGTVRAALAWFQAQGFVYTLRPGHPSGHPVDDFLFRSRRGFCEHFAAAFALLMRAAGVPARIVVGYLGGTWNPITEELVVRRSDAHAWVEVALPGHGWVRVDPTVAAAPARLALGIDPAVVDTAGVRFRAPGGRAGFLEALARWRDTADALWTYWVLGYGPRMQAWLLARLGLDGLSPWQALGLLLAVAAPLALVVAVGMGLRAMRRRDPAAEAWACFRARLARHGVPARPTDGPWTYGRRAAAACPGRAAEIDRIVALYVAVRYGPDGDAAAARALRRAVARFRP